jgi:hemoglobin
MKLLFQKWNELYQRMFVKSVFDLIGGKLAVDKLVDRFYDIMDSDEKYLPIRTMHAKSLDSSREKLKLFLYGWLGGPQTYTEKYGHPRMRMRHFPFKIGMDERDLWIECMQRALSEQTSINIQHQKQMLEAFMGLANRIVNQ